MRARGAQRGHPIEISRAAQRFCLADLRGAREPACAALLPVSLSSCEGSDSATRLGLGILPIRVRHVRRQVCREGRSRFRLRGVTRRDWRPALKPRSLSSRFGAILAARVAGSSCLEGRMTRGPRNRRKPRRAQFADSSSPVPSISCESAIQPNPRILLLHRIHRGDRRRTD